jgi:hypothetical protein
MLGLPNPPSPKRPPNAHLNLLLLINLFHNKTNRKQINNNRNHLKYLNNRTKKVFYTQRLTIKGVKRDYLDGGGGFLQQVAVGCEEGLTRVVELLAVGEQDGGEQAVLLEQGG